MAWLETTPQAARLTGIVSPAGSDITPYGYSVLFSACPVRLSREAVFSHLLARFALGL
jgi:hypothetical protein